MTREATPKVSPQVWNGPRETGENVPADALPQGSRDSDIPGLVAAAPVRIVPGPPYEERLAEVMSAVNPLLEAARPLLRVMCDLPQEMMAGGLDVLRRLLILEVKSFQALCAGAAIRHEHMVAASYALCTAIDEAVQRRPWGGGEGKDTGAWAAEPLSHMFHDDTKGGDKVFLLIGRLAASPQDHIDLLDLLFFVVALGFEGRFRTGTQGRRQLESIQHRLYEIVMRARGEVPRDLSPHWKDEVPGRFRLLRTVPVWVTASLLSLVLVAQFAWYKYQLMQASTGVEAGIRAIGAMRPPPAPPVPVHKALRLKELLAPEIARGSVSVEEDDKRSAVSFKGDDMFVPGQAKLNAGLLPTIAKVASEINEVPGMVRVTGHSDNRPIKTRQFPNNQALSEKRAAAVADVLASNGVAPARLVVEGKGDSQPVADNAQAAGRARNRRVEIVVTPGDVPATASGPAPSPASAGRSAP